MADVKPTKQTWKQFCQEPPLTAEEIIEWAEMTRHVNNDGFSDFMMERVQEEWQATNDVEPTEDWSDLVAWADASRRLKRAEIAAWREWSDGDG